MQTLQETSLSRNYMKTRKGIVKLFSMIKLIEYIKQMFLFSEVYQVRFLRLKLGWIYEKNSAAMKESSI